MNNIQVVRNPSKKRREIYRFTVCGAGNGITVSLDAYTHYRQDDEMEWYPTQSYTRTFTASDGGSPRVAGKKSREEILAKKHVPQDVKSEAIELLMKNVEFVN